MRDIRLDAEHATGHSEPKEVEIKRFIIVWVACLAPWVTCADSWEYTISPYIWLPSFSLDSANVNEGGSPIDGSRLEIGPVDYLSALKFFVMVSGDMRKDDWVFATDLVYVDFGFDDKDIDFGRPGSGPIAGEYAGELSGSAFSLAGGRTLIRRDRYYVDALIGWRRFAMTLDVTGDLDNGGEFDISNDLEFNDLFIAVDGRTALGTIDSWSLRYYADLGAGESKLTWQARVGLGYAFGWGDMFFDYRHLDYEVGDTASLEDVTTVFSGPMFGATFRFGGAD